MREFQWNPIFTPPEKEKREKKPDYVELLLKNNMELLKNRRRQGRISAVRVSDTDNTSAGAYTLAFMLGFAIIVCLFRLVLSWLAK